MNFFSFTKPEIRDIIYSTIALGFIFSISGTGVIEAIKNPSDFLANAAVITAIVALSFIPHELMHKFTAMRYRAYAQYEMWKGGLIFALLMAVTLGFVFAAPGAVVIYTRYRDQYGTHNIRLTRRENGLISSAGVVANLVIAGIFLALAPGNILTQNIIHINAFLAMFNLLPIPPLDGSKVLWWSIPVWAILFAASYILQGLV